MKKVIVSLTLCLSLILTGCASSSVDLMENIEEKEIKIQVDLQGEERSSISNFSVRLFQESFTGENTLISPISVLYALAMTMNGADRETLSQMEEVLGVSKDRLNAYLYTYLNQLPISDEYKLNMANSIWLKDSDSLTIKEEFLQTNVDYYDASIYKAAFDSSTLKDINHWIEDHTDGMIKNMLSEIPDSAVMYLINALVFDAKWHKEYENHQVRNGIFTKEDGTTQDIELMYSSEHHYIEDDKAEGFIKYYKERKYAFVALLPSTDISIEEYVSALTGEHVMNLLANPIQVEVRAAIPKFETEYSIEMSQILSEMGMKNAFDGVLADFSKIGSSSNGNLSISNVFHKTFISLHEKGTKAGAATIVEVNDSAAAEPEEYKIVHLDRPFVYMLMDCETNLPLFIGTMMDMEK